MPKLLVTNRAGQETAVEATAGLSVMENIRDNGFDELRAVRRVLQLRDLPHPRRSGVRGQAPGDERG